MIAYTGMLFVIGLDVHSNTVVTNGFFSIYGMMLAHVGLFFRDRRGGTATLCELTPSPKIRRME